MQRWIQGWIQRSIHHLLQHLGRLIALIAVLWLFACPIGFAQPNTLRSDTGAWAMQSGCAGCGSECCQGGGMGRGQMGSEAGCRGCGSRCCRGHQGTSSGSTTSEPLKNSERTQPQKTPAEPPQTVPGKPLEPNPSPSNQPAAEPPQTVPGKPLEPDPSPSNQPASAQTPAGTCQLQVIFSVLYVRALPLLLT